MGRLVEVADTKLYVEERGAASGFPLLVFHGGPGLDHTEFGDYLDPLTEGGAYRLVLVDERACGRSERTAPRETWTLERMAQDVSDLAASLGTSGGYATLGHSYGAFVVLQHAVDHPGGPRGTIVSAGIAAARWLDGVQQQLAAFEPTGLRAAQDYGGIDIEDWLGGVTHPVLVLAGRHDRVCPVAASQDMARRLPNAELVVFENSAHMTFAEEQDRYLATVRQFLGRITT